jgi:hypothetical protein
MAQSKNDCKATGRRTGVRILLEAKQNQQEDVKRVMRLDRWNNTIWNTSDDGCAQVAEAPVPFTRTEESDLERLKNRLLREALGRVANPAMIAPIRRAANEAAALAWLEPHPLLVLPTLFEEKALTTRRRALRQDKIRARTAGIMTVLA